jgi:hypothetical protein
MKTAKQVKILLKIIFLFSVFFLTGVTVPRPSYIIDPNNITMPGKMWIQGNTLYVNDKFTGVHVFTITNPAAPVRESFILISNNVDIAVLGTTLYADSFGHLKVYDITDPKSPVLRKVISNTVTYNYDYFNGVYLDEWGHPLYYSDYSAFGCMCTGIPDVGAATADSSGNYGTGGSTSRFAIYNNQYLYVLKDGQVIKGFDLTTPTNPQPIASAAYIPNSDAETLFPYEHFLFVGASTGVYIYDLQNPASPKYVSQMIHVRAWDPVVVQSNIAYVTLRNADQYPWDRLEIIGLNDFTNMTVLSITPMSYPQGLAVRGKYAYVCDTYNGLEICNVSNPQVVTRFNFNIGFVSYDAITYNDLLIITGDMVKIYSLTNTNTMVPVYLSTLH